MKFGKVYGYKDVEEAKKLIGKKVLASDFQKIVDKGEFEEFITELVEVKANNMRPFHTKDGRWRQFIREVEEEPKRMTNKQLAEWLARGNGQVDRWEYTHIHADYGFLKGEDDDEVPDDVKVRPWGSEEWIVPTLEIYERDCKNIVNVNIVNVAEDMVSKV